MKFIKTIERLQILNSLIMAEKTGSPERLANRLRISRRQLFNILEDLRDLGAPINYNKKLETYTYSQNFHLQIEFTFSIQNNHHVN